MKLVQRSMLVVVCLLSVAMTLGAAWTTKRLTNTGEDKSRPKIAVCNTNAYAVWVDGGGKFIGFRKSIDGGKTWQTSKNLSGITASTWNPDITINESNVYVVWMDETLGNYEIYFRRSIDGGATWKSIKNLSNNTGDSSSPRIAVNGSNVYVVWSDETPGNMDVYLRKSTDSGATWQTAKRLTNNTGDSFSPTIAVSSSNVYVVWHDSTPGNAEIFLKKSTDCGATWQTATRLTNNTGTSWFPKIAVNDPNVYVVWMDST